MKEREERGDRARGELSVRADWGLQVAPPGHGEHRGDGDTAQDTFSV